MFRNAHGRSRLLAPRLVMLLSGGLMAVTVIAFALQIRNGGDDGSDLAGFAMFMGLMLSLFSPLRKPEGGWDEREQGLQTKALSTGAHLVLLIILSAAFFNELAAPEHRTWVPSSKEDWRLLTSGIIAGWIGVSIFTAAWLTPPYAAELEAEDD